MNVLFAVYNKKGEILRHGNCPESMVQIQAQGDDELATIINQQIHDETQYKITPTGRLKLKIKKDK